MTDILIIDDDSDIRALVIDILTYSGFQSQAVSSGVEGLAALREHQPDLVLCDIDMPGVNGFQVLHELRNSPQTQSVPLIFLTAKHSRRDVRQGMEIGADDYLTKPFAPSELLAAVNTQLRKRSAVVQQYETTLRLVRRNIAYALPHELRTPLFGISGYAQLLKMDHKSIQGHQIFEYADSILTGSARLQRLIENFLVYAQLDMISDDPEQIEELHNHFVRDAVRIASKEAQAVATQYGRDSDLQLDLCDPTALQISEQDLRKIMREIVDNAFKFSPPGSQVYLAIKIEHNHLIISITDQGQGMSDEHISSIGAFMQFDRMLNEQQGIGLGLAIAKRLTELHEGKMNIQSQAGEGTFVSIEFRCE